MWLQTTRFLTDDNDMDFANKIILMFLCIQEVKQAELESVGCNSIQVWCSKRWNWQILEGEYGKKQKQIGRLLYVYQEELWKFNAINETSSHYKQSKLNEECHLTLIYGINWCIPVGLQYVGWSLKRNKHMCFIDVGNCHGCLKRETIAYKIQIIK